jgi:cytochrome P450
VSTLEQIEAAIEPANFFPLDLGDEAFRQNALSEYASAWATKAPFYARRLGIPTVVCTRAEDVRKVMLDPERFVMKIPPLPGYAAFDIFGGLESVLQMDGSRHARVRRLMNPAFAPLALPAIKPAVERIVEERLDVIAAGGAEFDAMSDLCDHLIVRSLLDATFELDPVQRAAFERVHRAIFALNFQPGQARPQEYNDAIAGARVVIHQIIEDRRLAPRDDFISKLISARDDGSRLDDDELYGQINTICGAALGSTATSLAASLYLLGRHPDSFDRIKQDETLIDNALDECLRMHCPGFFFFPRFAACDTEIGGTRILQNMVVLASPQAANFDPAEYNDPATFEITRKPKTMTFGAGAHHCIGILLAKMTMRIAMRAIVKRFPKIRLADPDFRPTYGGNVGTLTIKSLPMRID